MLDYITNSTPWPTLSILITSLLIITTIYLLTIRLRPGLRSIPGPFIASLSDLDKMLSAASGHQMDYHLSLHSKYGPLVRIGPNHVMFSDASLIPPVYGIASKFWKSDFYVPFDVKTPHGLLPTLFSIRDGNRHREMRRQIASAYTLSTLKELEPMNDACSEVFIKKFKGFVGKEVDLGTWVHWYAFDVITSITYSNTLGMMSQERDVDRIIESIENRLRYNAVIAQAPYLHKYLFGNTYVSKILNLIPSLAIMNKSSYIAAFAANQLARYQNKDLDTNALKDMLSRFKRMKDEEEIIDDAGMLSHSLSHILAGSDTTAASLRSVFYHLGRHQSAHDKVLAEIDAADQAGQLSDPVTFSEAQALPYLQAVLREALRMHPAVGLVLERVVASGGFTIPSSAGKDIHLPAGTVIGANPWVMARDTSVYGRDAYTFRPERWLEARPEELKLMERNDFAFGAGARTCLGKNISLLEMSKFVPQVLRRFELELVEPEREWELHDYWFVKQTGLVCRVHKRT